MPKKLAAQSFLKKSDEYPDTVSVCDYEDNEFEMGELYSVIQYGIWWRKSFSISYYVADTAAGGINSGGWWHDVKSGFKN